MKNSTRLSARIASALILFTSCAAVSWASKPDEAFATDPRITIKYMPGKYYEYEAQLAVKQDDFARALQMYEKASYWGNKVSQYNVGMLYINGAAGVPVDKVRGAAWLGIAAETHPKYVDKALGEVYASLDADQRAAAGKLWKELRVDYGDKVTLPRATQKFNDQLARDKGSSLGAADTTTLVFGSSFGFGGGAAEHALFDSGGNMQAAISQQTMTVNAAKLFVAVQDQFDDYINIQFGRVSVGEPESVADHQKELEESRPKKQ